jgi:hypothetical protein
MMGREAHHLVAIPPFCRGWIGRVVSWLKHLKGHFEAIPTQFFWE